MCEMSYSNIQFEEFCNNIRMSDSMIENIRYKYHRITKCINQTYWYSSSETDHSLYVGSYGRGTSIDSSDIDIVVELPYTVFSRYKTYSGNGPSSLLQHVRNSLLDTYSQSNISGDGQVVSIIFTDMTFEIVPVSRNYDGTYEYPDTNNGGSWKNMDPRSEKSEMDSMNKVCNHNLKRLCRMIRAWNIYNDVSLHGQFIDATCYDFIKSYVNKSQSYLYYDEMSRDYFKYMLDRNDRTYWYMPGSNRTVYPIYSFKRDVKVAYELATSAIESQNKGNMYTACKTWREIFGTNFPSY